ncbi:hypothetical protein [Microbacterium sp. H83]|uniref:hypothetical protein n=1 Tax=Microbacterium sp. H83 TaxID=1827324 RepID=UPI0007F3FFD7|nr:hypothetical protein [Microbacterium sp. H83]OAN43577.1 hypothetical protein A4X16_00440 [Microbacterium sp. H83]
MTSDSDDALNWDGDEGAPAPRREPKRAPRTGTSANAEQLPEREDRVVRGGASASTTPHDEEDQDERAPLSTAVLLTLGVVGGIYLLYSIGWVVGGLRLKPLANFFVADAMFLPWFVLAVAAPALWFLTSWVLTRGRASWVRVGALLLGVVLLVPWPFVTVGVVGA